MARCALAVLALCTLALVVFGVVGGCSKSSDGAGPYSSCHYLCSPPTCGVGTGNCDGGLSCDDDVLSDPANCGACGIVCPGACVSGTCREATVLASNIDSPAALVVTATDVWWSTFGDGGIEGTVSHVGKSGGDVSSIVGSAALSGTLATDGSRIVWTTGPTISGGIGAPDGQIRSALPGSPPITIADGQPIIGGPGATTDLVSWLIVNPGATHALEGRFADGGALERPYPAIVEQDMDVFQALPPTSSPIALGDSLFWVDGPTVAGAYGTLCMTTRSSATVATLQRNVMAIASDGAAVLAVVSGNAGAVVLTFSEAGAPTESVDVSFDTNGSVNGAAADRDSLFLTTSSAVDPQDVGNVLQISRADGTVTTVARQQDYPMGIAVDEESIYWAVRGNDSAGRIVKAAKR